LISHYTALHSAGVVHKDVESRHWLRHPDGGIRIIGFEAAVRVDASGNGYKTGNANGSGRGLMENEMAEVKDLLGLS